MIDFKKVKIIKAWQRFGGHTPRGVRDLGIAVIFHWVQTKRKRVKLDF